MFTLACFVNSRLTQNSKQYNAQGNNCIISYKFFFTYQNTYSKYTHSPSYTIPHTHTNTLSLDSWSVIHTANVCDTKSPLDFPRKCVSQAERLKPAVGAAPYPPADFPWGTEAAEFSESDAGKQRWRGKMERAWSPQHPQAPVQSQTLHKNVLSAENMT